MIEYRVHTKNEKLNHYDAYFVTLEEAEAYVQECNERYGINPNWHAFENKPVFEIFSLTEEAEANARMRAARV